MAPGSGGSSNSPGSPTNHNYLVGRAGTFTIDPGMTVVVCPSSCVGSLAFKHAAGVDPYDESIVVGGGAIEIAHRAQRSLGGIGGGHEQQDRQDHRHQTGGCGNRAVARKRAASHRSTG